MAPSRGFKTVKPIAVHMPNAASILSHIEASQRQSGAGSFKVKASDWKLPKAKSASQKSADALAAMLKDQNSSHSHGGLLGHIMDNLGSDVIDTIKGIPG